MADVVSSRGVPRTSVVEDQPAAVRSWNPSDRLIALLFVLPTLVLIALLYVFPLSWNVYFSFTNFSAVKPPAPVWVGIDNYVSILRNENIWFSFVTTATYVLAAVGVECLLGFGIAMLLNRRFSGAGLITTLLLLPMMVSPALAAAFWGRKFFHPQGGLFNYYFIQLGMTPPDWLGNPRMAMLSLILVDIWQWTPFMLLLSLAGLSAVPRYLYEAAEVDQASGWFKFREITLPTVWPLMVIALIFRSMDAVRVFEQQWVTSGYNQTTPTIATAVYGLAFRNWDTGLASALACIILVLTLAMTSMWVRFLSRIRS